jgi:hypothetical protein
MSIHHCYPFPGRLLFKMLIIIGPDIIIKNKKDKTCLLIDVAIPSDKNAI